MDFLRVWVYEPVGINMIARFGVCNSIYLDGEGFQSEKKDGLGKIRCSTLDVQLGNVFFKEVLTEGHGWLS